MNTNDLINFASQSKPVEMGDAFNELMAGRIAERVDSLRSEVTAGMFGVPSTGAEE